MSGRRNDKHRNTAAIAQIGALEPQKKVRKARKATAAKRSGPVCFTTADVKAMVAMATLNTDSYQQLKYRAVSSNFQI
jgi:hypothetical protein